MASLRRILIGCAWIFALLIASAAVVDAQQVGKDRDEEWKLVNSYGFPAWIASNVVIDAPALSHRHIYLLIDGNDFTEANIRTVFTSLAAEFRMPHELWIYAYSDRAVVEKAVDKRKSGILCDGIFEDSPEGRRASRNAGIMREPKRSGYYRAQYFRFSDGREEFEYSPHPEQEHVLKIDLRNTSPVYSGDLNKDLVSAAERGDLDKGAEVNMKDNNGFSPLMTAAMDGGREIVQLLLEKGADVNARTGSDRKRLDDTTLMLAALHGHAGIVEHLLAKGAKREERNRFGETALMQAALAGFSNVVLLLAVQGADVNTRDVDDRTALMLAQDDKETIETLLGLGADYNVTDKDGMTPLMQAVRWYQSKKADALISSGAGKESVDACKAYLAATAPKNDPYPGYRKEEGYRILTEIYIRLGLKKEAVETSKQALAVLGDKAHLRARLGFTYVAVGDKESALAQYRILTAGAARAQDNNTKRLYQGWRDALFQQLNK